jgi:uncharacterized protein (DUF1778 family)
MTSDDTPNLPAVNGQATPDPDEEKTIGGRATAAERYLVDRACLELGIKRGPFVVEAAVERARMVLAAKQTLETPVL